MSAFSPSRSRRSLAERVSNKKPRAPWGDGFNEDGWREIVGVCSWETCVTDEYIRLFPRLIPQGGLTPGPLLDHLQQCIIARAWQLHVSGSLPVTLRSVTPDQIVKTGQEAFDSWFDGPTWLERLVLQIRLPSRGFRSLEHSSDLLFLDGVLSESRAGPPSEIGESAMTRFASLSGIHPAYFWKSGLLSHQRETAAAWLGILKRGRAALIPLDVAEYLLSVVGEGDDGQLIVSDQAISMLLRGAISVEQIWEASCAKVAGEKPLVRPQRHISAGWAGLASAAGFLSPSPG